MAEKVAMNQADRTWSYVDGPAFEGDRIWARVRVAGYDKLLSFAAGCSQAVYGQHREFAVGRFEEELDRAVDRMARASYPAAG